MSQDAAKPTSKTQTSTSLRAAFPGYFPPSEDLLRAMLTSGLVVFDTNPLLNTYKLTGTARREFLSALQVLGDRLWIPHQVGLEFLRNRATVIDQSNTFPKRFRTAVESLHKEVQQLKEHRGLKDEEVSSIKEAIDDAITRILKDHADLYTFEVAAGTPVDKDPVFMEIEKIISEKVGPPFSNLAEVTKTGNQRLKEKVPPGYSDTPDKREGAIGDYFVWEQTLLEADKRHLPVLFVTNEKKEDWIRKEGSYPRGPRPELVAEMLARTGQPFHLMDVGSFLLHARKYLLTSVSDSTIEQAESVQKQTIPFALSSLEQLLGNQVENVARINDLLIEMSPEQRATLHRLLGGSTASLKSSPEDLKQLLSALTALHSSSFDFEPIGGSYYWVRPRDHEEWVAEKVANDFDWGDDESSDSDD